MTDEPQVALTAPPITHVWATTYESDFERKQRKVTCLRAEKGLSRCSATCTRRAIGRSAAGWRAEQGWAAGGAAAVAVQLSPTL